MWRRCTVVVGGRPSSNASFGNVAASSRVWMCVVGGSPHHAARVLVALSAPAINRVNRSRAAERTAARVAGSPLAMTAVFGRPMGIDRSSVRGPTYSRTSQVSVTGVMRAVAPAHGST